MSSTLQLIISIVVPLAAGFIGSFFTTPSIPTWYASLVKPSFNPPSWVFGPVWTTLYILMGIGAYIVWKKGFDVEGVKIALAVFLVQLVLNTLWSILFFGLHNPGVALIEIALLWISIVVTIVLFSRVSAPAAWLLAPYIAWVSFASFLNYSIWRLN